MQQETSFVQFKDDTSLVKLLKLEAPPFSRNSPFAQLTYIEKYVRELGCQSLAIEQHYVDRDYIEDHSLFYSRSFSSYPNHCRRIHFFAKSATAVRARIALLEEHCGSDESTRQREWKAFSKEAYLGFAVIKPLQGSPVGRTVLKAYRGQPEDEPSDTREFSACRRYNVHLGAIELTVDGLAFQQQDVGVSACATTALWSSLHNVRAHEEIGSPTPAQITTLATQYSLPFGRPTPSDEGLSIDQMCQALHALRVAPSLLRADEDVTTRSYICSALRSGFAPVLVVQSSTDEDTWHAVTAVGFRKVAPVIPKDSTVRDLANDTIALYVHDDRIGPYERVNLASRKKTLLLVNARSGLDHEWFVRFVLIPTHAKIRLSFSALREITLASVGLLVDATETLSPKPARGQLWITHENWISRSHAYLQTLMAQGGDNRIVARSLMAAHALPRYIGIVSLQGPFFGRIDVLIDTTSTMKNLNTLAVVSQGGSASLELATAIAAKSSAPVIASRS